MVISDRRERAQRIWVSHLYPFLIACLTFLTFLDSMFPFSKLSIRIIRKHLHKEKMLYKNLFSYNEINKCNFFCNFHTSSIININAFFSAFYILVWSVILIVIMSLKFLYIWSFVILCRMLVCYVSCLIIRCCT
jgi:hypothetical protein